MILEGFTKIQIDDLFFHLGHFIFFIANFIGFILLLLAGVLQNHLRISKPLATYSYTDAWKSKPVAKADALWISQV